MYACAIFHIRRHIKQSLKDDSLANVRAMKFSPPHARKEESGRGHPAPRKGAAAPLTPASGEHYIALSSSGRAAPCSRCGARLSGLWYDGKCAKRICHHTIILCAAEPRERLAGEGESAEK